MRGYGEYENLIVERLDMPNVDVSPLPLTWILNQAKAVSNPRVYVIFSGSSFVDSDRLGEFAQDETLTFKLVIEARTREGENGVFAVAEEVIQRLLTWKLPDTTRRISLTSFGYVDGIQNNWQYQLVFESLRVRIRPEPEEDGKLIKKITINDSTI